MVKLKSILLIAVLILILLIICNLVAAVSEKTLTATVAALVGLGAMSIAYQQWKTSHLKLAADQFDKRFDLYSEVRQQHLEVWKRQNNELGPCIKLQRTAMEARFLFNDNISAQLWAMSAMASAASAAHTEEEKDIILGKNNSLYSKAHREFTDALLPYMNLSTIKTDLLHI